MDIKVSAIVPVYNTEKFLEKCIRSIMSQTLKEIEIICINDGSTDSSLEILKKLQKEDNRIIIIDKKNEGVSKARNVGIENVRGKYCLNIDSDDWVESNYFKTMYEKAKLNNLEMLVSDFITERENNQEIKKDLEISEEAILTGEEYLEIFYSRNFNGYTWNKLIETSLYKKNKINYNEDIGFCEDVEVLSKLASNMKRIGKINNAYYHYKVDNFESITKQEKIKNYSDFEECCYQIKKYFEKKNISSKVLNLLFQREIYTKLDILLRGKFKEEKEKYIIKEREFLKELKKNKIRKFKLENVNKMTKVCLWYLVNISSNKINLIFFKKIIKIKRKLRK